MINKFEFKIIEYSLIDETEFNSTLNKTIFTTLSWLNFVAKDAGASPIIIKIFLNDEFVGYFTALSIKKIGIKILGSPFNGWSTCFMGIDTIKKIDKIEIIKELIPFLFKKLKCNFIQIIDRDISIDEACKLKCKVNSAGTLELPINMDNDALFKQMKTDCRNFIRQFERRGAKIEIANPDHYFAEQYYEQLIDVFAKQGLVPTYSINKVYNLIDSLKDTDNILCLRVISPENKCIATSIFLGYGFKFFFWGGASYREDQHYRPNEYMIWTAIQYWRDKGCTTFDMVGIRDYKRKFGSHEEHYASMEFAKNKLLMVAKNVAQKSFYRMTKIKGFFLRRK